uniref:HMG box domain-containing protein n=1 Tax=Strigamia maritima TaxID=126957 RepID=T1JFX6_STRMM
MADTECDGSENKDTECDSESEGNGVVRRPMNAFLIFCKRHRSLVREKYPHMENRSITKILGEWWANLEANEKVTYTDLAKQICSAKSSFESDQSKMKSSANDGREVSMSDETKEYFCNEKETTVSNQQLINCIIEKSIGSSQDTVRLNGAGTKLFANELESINKDRKYSDDEFQVVNKSEGGICRKSQRKGKGNRYQALLNEGVLQPPKDRRHASNYTKRGNEEKGNLDANSEEMKSLNLDAQIAALPRCSFDALIKKKRKSDSFSDNDRDYRQDGDGKASEGSSDGDVNSKYIDENDGKARFQSGGFDLEKQIAALPSLNIDLLNQHNRSPEEESNRLDTRPTLVGSQKRKARKRSITHLDPSSEHKPYISVVEPILLNTLSTVARPNE